MLTFFDILKNILTKEKENLEDDINFDSVFQPYMLVRYLSMRDSLLPYAGLIQTLQNAQIDNRTIYQWAYKHIPAGNPYIKYIAKPKKKS